ncbi:MAG: inorganic phosphate transporter [Luteolibacter sp.]|uniref:inorganic phosphate transporter n=1 Tax=Luteolibacter sp. TaxID=1962973 RepID=UPI003263DAE4
MSLGIIFLVIFIALAFEYINGFHDTANSIATVVGTKVMTPRQAIAMAAITNLIGALAGHAVAKTVSSGLVDAQFVSPMVIVCALLGGIAWNLLTWWFGLPSSSTHALVGGICGATLASSHDNWHAIIWSVKKVKDGKEVMEGVLHKVLMPMITSPIIGFIGGFLLMGFLYFLLQKARPRFVNRFFGKAQIFSASYMGFAHGLADAQKTMGVITLALVTATATGSFQNIPDWLGFLRMGKSMQAEHSVTVIKNPKSTPEQLIEAANVLEQESTKLAPGEYREAFQILAAKTLAATQQQEATQRLLAVGSATHREILAAEDDRILTKIPVLGSMVAGKHTDWLKTLDSEMKSAGEKGKAPLPAAAAKVADLSPDVPVWIKVICSLTMAAGTMAGGWRIIKTLGHKMVKLQPVHGFAAETVAATLLAVTGSYGMTVSTTHSITTSIMGVGCAKRFSALNLSLIERILWAWVLTLPAAGGVAYILVKIFRLFGWLP